MSPQRSFNFARLDPEAANLHLRVKAPEKLYFTAGQITRQIARPVQHG